MASAQVRTRTSSGDLIVFDVDDASGVGPERVSSSGRTVVGELDEPLDAVLASSRPAVEAVIEAFRGLTPDEVGIEFGLRIDAQAGMVFAKAGIGAHFTVNLKFSSGTGHKEDVRGGV
jgi:hypothetical protein